MTSSNPDSTANEDALLEAELPGWSPSPRDQLDPLDPDVTTVEIPTSTTTLGDDELLDEWNPSPSSPSTTTEEGPGPSEPTSKIPPGSSPASIADPTIAAALADVFAVGCNLTGLLLDRSIGHGGRHWLMAPHEAAAISEPLGRIAARRVPVSSNQASDVADGIEAGVATIAYATRATVEQYSGPDTEPAPSSCLNCRRTIAPGTQHVPTAQGLCDVVEGTTR